LQSRWQTARSDVVAAGKLKSTNGVYGIRLAHNTNGCLTDFKKTKGIKNSSLGVKVAGVSKSNLELRESFVHRFDSKRGFDGKLSQSVIPAPP
jgi:hypothetical protein